MNIVANNIASKLFVAFVAAAMLFTLATPAKAATAEELQQMINQLLAQVAALQAQAGQGGSMAAGVCPYTWTRSLNTGATGADVMKLQQFLNADADTRVSASGVGSAGMETEYYGPATAAAVSKLQVKYRADVLSPAGLVNPTGYFGPSTMAKANALCASAPVVVPPVTGDDSSDDSDDDSSSGSLSGEASLSNMEIDSASDDELDEGSEDAEVAVMTVEFEDGDAMISRIDVSFDKSGTDVWDVLDEVALWVDGDEIARADASDEDEYQDEDTGTLRFSGLDLIAEEDEELEVVITATIQGTVDSTDQGTFNVSVDSMRWSDADDVTETETTGEDFTTDVTFTVGEAGQDDELIVKTSSEDPDGTTLQVEDDAKSDWYTIFAFDLDTDDSENDIELNELSLIVDTASSSGSASTFLFSEMVDDVELVIDGVTIDDLVVAGGTATTTAAGFDESRVLRFDVDGDVTIDAGDRVTAELRARFKSLAAAEEGATVRGRVTSANAEAIDAEGADNLTAAQLSGAATGDTHTLRTAGVDVSLESVNAAVTVNDSTTDDYGTYTIKLEVTAFEQDVYISTNPATSISYTLEDGASSSSVAGTRSVTLSSTADEEGSTFEVTEGSTETFTLTVTYTPGVANTAARMQLNTITFGSTSGAPNTQSWTASPETDYRTAVVTMVN